MSLLREHPDDLAALVGAPKDDGAIAGAVRRWPSETMPWSAQCGVAELVVG